MQGHTSVFTYTKAHRIQAETSSQCWSLISGSVWTVGLLVVECTAHSSSFDRLQLKNNPLDVNKCACPPSLPHSTSVRGKQGFTESQSGTCMYVCAYRGATRGACVWVLACTCVHRGVLSRLQDWWFITGKPRGRGPCQELLSWKQMLETADLLSVSSSDVGTSTRLSVSLCFSTRCLSVLSCFVTPLRLFSCFSLDGFQTLTTILKYASAGGKMILEVHAHAHMHRPSFSQRTWIHFHTVASLLHISAQADEVSSKSERNVYNNSDPSLVSWLH